MNSPMILVAPDHLVTLAVTVVLVTALSAAVGAAIGAWIVVRVGGAQ